MSDTNKKQEEAVVSCGTTKGPLVMQFSRSWSPIGYDRVVELFERGFYNHSHFFRVAPHYLVQFGISYSHDKELQSFARRAVPDDPPLDPPMVFDTGIISFAGTIHCSLSLSSLSVSCILERLLYP
jgi:cyclophilin family peptidyl-prolyl cis-trans isomerase